MSEDLESIRRRYLPREGIRALLLGESPPPTRGFFYTGDSTLYRETVPVFVSECDFPREREEFLQKFADAGFYLDDFSPHRGDRPGERPDDPDVQEAVARLAALIDEHEPVAVIGVLKRIAGLVRKTVEASSRRETQWRCLRFPYRNSDEAKREYANGLKGLLADFGCMRRERTD